MTSNRNVLVQTLRRQEKANGYILRWNGISGMWYIAEEGKTKAIDKRRFMMKGEAIKAMKELEAKKVSNNA